jgi:hypothetical protein
MRLSHGNETNEMPKQFLLKTIFAENRKQQTANRIRVWPIVAMKLQPAPERAGKPWRPFDCNLALWPSSREKAENVFQAL